jgi:hypothetical protein
MVGWLDWILLDFNGQLVGHVEDVLADPGVGHHAVYTGRDCGEQGEEECGAIGGYSGQSL